MRISFQVEIGQSAPHPAPTTAQQADATQVQPAAPGYSGTDWVLSFLTVAMVAGIAVPQFSAQLDKIIPAPFASSQGISSDKAYFPLAGLDGTTAKLTDVPGSCREKDCSRRHAGSDYAAPAGAKVVAVLGGKIVEKDPQSKAGGILGIESNWQGKKIKFRYVHLAPESISHWQEGDKVKAGEEIALIGEKDAMSTGTHLHIERYENGELDMKSHEWLKSANKAALK